MKKIRKLKFIVFHLLNLSVWIISMDEFATVSHLGYAFEGNDLELCGGANKTTVQRGKVVVINLIEILLFLFPNSLSSNSLDLRIAEVCTSM